MADEELEESDRGDGEDEGEDEESSGSKKKLILIIGLVILLIVGAAGAAFFTGLLDPLIKPSEETETKKDEGGPTTITSAEATFFDLPELLVNLNAGTRKSTFLKIRVSLELEKPGDVETVRQLMPRVIDNFQVYLRELRIDDLKGSAGMYRLREELLTRVNAAAFPARVNSVLFKEMLVQ
ncbi:MAG: flagellar basal body-associated FliL family protein [Proteobacteria bacterium]|nr:flagellar basal body-associated FliL family protein [Pseudomonadota bacterium]